MSKRKMPANGKAERGSSLLYDNNNAITDHNNNHLTNFNNNNQDNSEQSNEQLSHSNVSSPTNIKKETDYNDLGDQNSSQLNDEDIIEDDEHESNDAEEDELADDNLQMKINNSNKITAASRSLLNSRLTNGALPPSPLNVFSTSTDLNQNLEKQTKFFNHLNILGKNENLINKTTKQQQQTDGDSILESLSNLTNLNNLNSLSNLNNLNSLTSFNSLSQLNLSNLSSLNNQLNNLTNLNNLNNLGLNSSSVGDDNYGVLINPNDDDDEDSSNMVITPDIGDYASFNDDDLDDQMNLKQNLASIDDDEELDSDLLNDGCSKDDREGCRSLICDSNGIIIAEMVYRCMVCSNISDSITDAQRHYQLKHIFNQSCGLNSSPLNNFNNWKSNSANSSRSSNSSNNLVQQMKNKELQRKKQLQRIQEIKLQQQRIQMQRIHQQVKIKEQKLKQKTNQQRLIQFQQQQQQQQQLQLQQNQRLEQLRHQHLNELAQHMHQQQQQQQSNSDSPQQIQSVSNAINSVADLNTFFLNPPLPGTVSKSTLNMKLSLVTNKIN